MKRNSWLPVGIDDIVQQVLKAMDWVVNHRQEIGLAGGTPLGIWFDDYESVVIPPLLAAYERWRVKEERNARISQAMRTAMKEFIPHYRKFHHLMVSNPLVTDEYLLAMGYSARPVHKCPPTPVAMEPPVFKVLARVGHCIHINYYPFNLRGGRAKPAGQHGVEILWDYAEAEASDPEQFTHSFFNTASPAVLIFPAGDAGRKVRLVLRWENKRGKKGPFSNVYNCVVP
ncbi:MAG: hypothetical protein LBS05_07540 [Tannerellaceae bacterium]|nr:hypothetical protein [Tannerellaceae bacterium]